MKTNFCPPTDGLSSAEVEVFRKRTRLFSIVDMNCLCHLHVCLHRLRPSSI